MTQRLCRLMFVVTVLLSLASWSHAMASIGLPDIQGVCTENLTVGGEAAGFVHIRTASEDEPGANARFRSYGWSPWPKFTGGVKSVYHYQTHSRAYVSVGKNIGTQWLPYYTYTTVSRRCTD